MSQRWKGMHWSVAVARNKLMCSCQQITFSCNHSPLLSPFLFPASLQKPLLRLPDAPLRSITWAYWETYGCDLWLITWRARDQTHSLEWPMPSCPESGRASSSASSTTHTFYPDINSFQEDKTLAWAKMAFVTFCIMRTRNFLSYMCTPSLVCLFTHSHANSPFPPYNFHRSISQCWWYNCSSPRPKWVLECDPVQFGLK